MSFRNSMYITLCYFPLVWIAIFYAFVLRATNFLGHLPIPSINDPKDIGSYIHYGLIHISYFVLIGIIIPVWCFMTFVRNSRNRLGIKVEIHSFYFVAGLALLFVLCRSDPGRMFEWFAD
jgi:hypothetical protein